MSADRDICGVLTVDKPQGMTSHDVVNRIRRLYGTKKVGHTGTLDPMATGVLVILIGRAAKAAEYLTAWDKEYQAGLALGITTDTGDTTGTVLSKTEPPYPDEDTVKAVCRSFLGKTEQVPPMYSALKVNGQKLLDLARKGMTVERTPRPIEITRLDAVPQDAAQGRYELTVACSKGTYIRVLCEDIGAKVGCGGTMCALRRLRTGAFSVTDAVTLSDLEEMTQQQRDALLVPLETVFSDLPRVTPHPFFVKLSRSGCPIYQKKIGTAFPVGTRVALYDEQGFYALGEAEPAPEEKEAAPDSPQDGTPRQTVIRTVKLFRLD